MSSSRIAMPGSFTSLLICTVEASWNSTTTRVISASACTKSAWMSMWPMEKNTKPATTLNIGAVRLALEKPRASSA